jgi:bla regulator protein blaR1
MTAPDLQTLAQVFTGRLLNTAVVGIVLAAMVWMLLRLIGRQNSGTRFAIWFSSLLAIVALPFISGSRFLAAHSPDFPAAIPHRTITLTLSSSWAFYLFAAWGVGAGLLLIRLGVGLWRVRQLRRRCSAVDLTTLDPAIARLLQDFAARRSVTLCVSREVAVPTAIGFFQSAIVFPAWLLSQLSAAEIEVILLHEMAHLRRFDDWTNLAQKIVKAVFFFHPAVWWIENRLTLEREMACDDMVLAQTASPRAYASSLISFAEKLQTARGLALAQALVSRMRHMTLRVAQILDAQRPNRTALWTPVLGLSAGMLALVFVATPYAPQLVAFQQRPSQVQPESMQATRALVQPGFSGAGMSRTGTENVAPLPRMIPASFNPRAAAPVVVPRLKTTSPRKPRILRASAVQQEFPVQQTFFILQTTQYDASGSGIWTLCIWRVRAGSLSERQLQSAIILDSI